MLINNGTKEQITAWQSFLKTRGHQIDADGVFGQKTKLATKNFQTLRGLRPDGLVGDNTIGEAKKLGFVWPLADIGIPISNKPDDQTAAIVTTNSFDPRGLLKHVAPTLRGGVIKIIELAHAEGYDLRVTQGLRTITEQDALYAQGRTKPGKKVTNAKGGQSNHNYGLAVDLAFFVDGKLTWEDSLYLKIGKWAKSAGLLWGGNWKSPDMPHVELPNLPGWRELKTIHDRRGMDAVWQTVGGTK